MICQYDAVHNRPSINRQQLLSITNIL